MTDAQNDPTIAKQQSLNPATASACGRCGRPKREDISAWALRSREEINFMRGGPAPSAPCPDCRPAPGREASTPPLADALLRCRQKLELADSYNANLDAGGEKDCAYLDVDDLRALLAAVDALDKSRDAEERAYSAGMAHGKKLALAALGEHKAVLLYCVQNGLALPRGWKMDLEAAERAVNDIPVAE